MTTNADAFKALEYSTWQAGAENYDKMFGAVTRRAIEPLLDATSVGPGARFLEMCCGTGFGVDAAFRRGAKAHGIDLAPAMIEKGRALNSNVDLQVGDAEEMPYPGGSFDSVICPFGLNHLPTPERAVREAWRILSEGGRFAFTLWCPPGKSKFHELVQEAVRIHGVSDVKVPPVPARFRFGEPGLCEGVLKEAGFANARVTELPLAFELKSGFEVVQLAYTAPRLALVLNAQPEVARARVQAAIADGAERFRDGSVIRLPIPALLTVGAKV